MFFSLPGMEEEEIEDVIQFFLRIARDVFLLVHFVSSQRVTRQMRRDLVQFDIPSLETLDNSSEEEEGDDELTTLIAGGTDSSLSEVIENLLPTGGEPGLLESLQSRFTKSPRSIESPALEEVSDEEAQIS
mmetsp:Transcript_68201/g.160403  ORF Transcript_68201/g.160403 Transcript_68201/m.160403 type:complete len:131 (-) Transcript_68201:63-455(-)